MCWRTLWKNRGHRPQLQRAAERRPERRLQVDHEGEMCVTLDDALFPH